MDKELRIYSWDDIASGGFIPRSHLAAAGYEGTALTVGGFDGVHLGHQALFSAVLRQKNLLPGVITFGTSPRARLHPETFSGSVYTMEQRLQLIKGAGFAFVVVIDFSGDFGRMDGVVFLQHLREKLYMSYLAEGTDFRCGYKGSVTIDFLRNFSQETGIILEVVEPVIAQGVRVSSSEIRRSISEGDFSRCQGLLGRNYALDGLCFDWTWTKESLVGMRKRGPCGCLQILPPTGRYKVQVCCKQSEKNSCEFSFAGEAIIQEASLEMILPPLEEVSGETPLVDSVEFTV